MLRCEWVPGTWVELFWEGAYGQPQDFLMSSHFWINFEVAGRRPHLIFTFYGNLTLGVVRSLRQTGTMHMTNRQRNKHNEQSPTKMTNEPTRKYSQLCSKTKGLYTLDAYTVYI